jgi:hypothetical protein
VAFSFQLPLRGKRQQVILLFRRMIHASPIRRVERSPQSLPTTSSADHKLRRTGEHESEVDVVAISHAAIASRERVASLPPQPMSLRVKRISACWLLSTRRT